MKNFYLPTRELHYIVQHVKIKQEGEFYMKNLLKKCFVELLGTFFFIFTICCSIFPNGRGAFPPLAIGFALIVLVYMGGTISGGHYNPAVSLAASVRGALKWRDFIPYVISQIIGGSLGALIAGYIVAIPPYSNETSFSIIPMTICEFLFTFLLCYVVLQVTTSEKTKGNSYFGFAIGSVVLIGLLATVGTCYGAFNPAVALGLLVIGFAQCKFILITILTNFVAGAAAAGVYKLTEIND